MKVKFANTEVEVWKLRKGVVIGCGSQYVHLLSILESTRGTRIGVEYPDGTKERWLSSNLEWLEPHN